jgi:hypothetical protein
VVRRRGGRPEGLMGSWTMLCAGNPGTLCSQ